MGLLGVEASSVDPLATSAQRPRLVFVSYTAEWVGPTNSLSLLLSRFRKQFDILVQVPGRGAFTDRLRDLQIPFEEFRALNKWDTLAMRRSVRAFGGDLVYANSSHSSSRIALLAARLAQVPAVIHVREMAWTKSRWRMGYLGHAARVIAVSDACADSVRRFTRPGTLVTIHNGIPLDSVRPGSKDLRARVRADLSVDAEAFMVTSVGHVMPRKGQDFGLSAFVRLAESHPEARFVVVGRTERNAEYVRRLRSRITDLGLEKRVLVTGFRTDVGDILSASDVFLHTAVSDPHPRSVIEAMARGLPVVAFAVDGVAETVVDGETGILTALEDVDGLAEGLKRLASSTRDREAMGTASQRRVEEYFTEAVTAEKVACEIHAVLAQRRQGS